MSSITDEVYRYGVDVKNAEKAYFEQLNKDNIPVRTATTILNILVSAPGEHTPGEIAEQAAIMNSKCELSEDVIEKFLTYQHLIGNVARTGKNTYAKPYYA